MILSLCFKGFCFTCGNSFCIPEGFDLNISHQLLQNNLCEFTTREHKFIWVFCTKNRFLNVRLKDF